jgi:hypothetical protein
MAVVRVVCAVRMLLLDSRGKHARLNIPQGLD